MSEPLSAGIRTGIASGFLEIVIGMEPPGFRDAWWGTASRRLRKKPRSDLASTALVDSHGEVQATLVHVMPNSTTYLPGLQPSTAQIDQSVCMRRSEKRADSLSGKCSVQSMYPHIEALSV